MKREETIWSNVLLTETRKDFPLEYARRRIFNGLDPNELLDHLYAAIQTLNSFLSKHKHTI